MGYPGDKRVERESHVGTEDLDHPSDANAEDNVLALPVVAGREPKFILLHRKRSSLGFLGGRLWEKMEGSFNPYPCPDEDS